jgi:hypothetical protein
MISIQTQNVLMRVDFIFYNDSIISVASDNYQNITALYNFTTSEELSIVDPCTLAPSVGLAMTAYFIMTCVYPQLENTTIIYKYGVSASAVQEGKKSKFHGLSLW